MISNRRTFAIISHPDAGKTTITEKLLLWGKAIGIEELLSFAQTHIHERAAQPKHIEILPELPKTAVGKVFKPDLGRLGIQNALHKSDALNCFSLIKGPMTVSASFGSPTLRLRARSTKASTKRS